MMVIGRYDSTNRFWTVSGHCFAGVFACILLFVLAEPTQARTLGEITRGQ